VRIFPLFAQIFLLWYDSMQLQPGLLYYLDGPFQHCPGIPVVTDHSIDQS
jgi:hypothetical protein